jgi:hypothetical protein
MSRHFDINKRYKFIGFKFKYYDDDDEFHKKWYDRVNEFHSLYQFNNRLTYVNYISPGRFFLGKLDCPSKNDIMI